MYKYKVGDRVIVIKTEYTSQNDFWKPGKIFVIERISDTYCNSHGDTQYLHLGSAACGNTDVELVEEYKKPIKLYGIAKFCKENYV